MRRTAEVVRLMRFLSNVFLLCVFQVVFRDRLNAIHDAHVAVYDADALFGGAGVLFSAFADLDAVDEQPHAFFFLVGALNNILTAPVYFQDDVEARRLEQLQSCFAVLEDVLTLREIFEYALHFCLDKENLSDKPAAERMVGFYNKVYSRFYRADGKLALE
jgi:hypothetical protein